MAVTNSTNQLMEQVQALQKHLEHFEECVKNINQSIETFNDLEGQLDLTAKNVDSFILTCLRQDIEKTNDCICKAKNLTIKNYLEDKNVENLETVSKDEAFVTLANEIGKYIDNNDLVELYKKDSVEAGKIKTQFKDTLKKLSYSTNSNQNSALAMQNYEEFKNNYNTIHRPRSLLKELAITPVVGTINCNATAQGQSACKGIALSGLKRLLSYDAPMSQANIDQIVKDDAKDVDFTSEFDLYSNIEPIVINLGVAEQLYYEGALIDLSVVAERKVGEKIGATISYGLETYSIILRSKKKQEEDIRAEDEVVFFDPYGWEHFTNSKNSFSITFKNREDAAQFLAIRLPFHSNFSSESPENTVTFFPLKLKGEPSYADPSAHFFQEFEGELESLDSAFEAIKREDIESFDTELNALPLLSAGPAFIDRIKYHVYFQHLKSRPQVPKGLTYGNDAFYGENKIQKASNPEIQEALNRVRIEIVLGNLLESVETDHFEKIKKYLHLLKKIDENKYNSLKSGLWKLSHQNQDVETKNITHPDFGGKAFANEESCAAPKKYKIQAIQDVMNALAAEWSVGQNRAEFKKFN